jgi:hypothetical protein
MGCHTWFAYKSNRTIEEAREILINSYKERLLNFSTLTDNEKIDYYEFCYESNEGAKNNQDAIEFINNIFDHARKVLERKIRVVSKGLCNVAVMNHQPEHSYFNEKGFFIVCKNFHDCFRLYGYPDIKFYSKKENYKFLKCNKNNPMLVMYDYTYDRLEEFWNTYPDGYIHFG